ncbi:MAG: hypothetical protein K2G97_02370 [Oscillospiraceae bacterium]|nr:hypothetical protein [Oscillospiraceae bacterium]
MAIRTNLAYESAYPSRVGQAIPSIRKIEKKESLRVKPFSWVFVVLMISSLLCLSVFSMVRLNEITSQISSLEKQYKIQKSDQIRLNSELESKISYSSIEDYATKNWGMKKQSSNQVNYINISKGNSIEVANEQEKNFLDELFDGIKHIFS